MCIRDSACPAHAVWHIFTCRTPPCCKRLCGDGEGSDSERGPPKLTDGLGRWLAFARGGGGGGGAATPQRVPHGAGS